MLSKISTTKAIGMFMAALISSSFLLLGYSAPSLEVSSLKGNDQMRLMTWNLYQGSNTSPIFAATTPAQFVTAVGVAYGKVQATDFPARAEVIASKIEKYEPDLIGLQEAVLYRTQTPSDGTATPAIHVTYDFIQILLDELSDRGLHYHVAAVQEGSDIEAPGLFSTGLMDVRLTDRDAILARDNIKAFSISNAQGAQYSAKLPISSPVGSLLIPRAWVSLDVTFNDGKKARVVSTHLDPISPTIQGLQAAELLSGPGNTEKPFVFMGDFNSNADGSGTATYDDLISAGMRDSWIKNGDGSGFTCCQSADLLNSDSALNRRIDLALLHGNLKVQDIAVIGSLQKDRTSSGLWPSDHAGLEIKLKLE
jgi:endonuclease/exonuclease/phosphatase family metal-dependent hydrolase